MVFKKFVKRKGMHIFGDQALCVGVGCGVCGRLEGTYVGRGIGGGVAWMLICVFRDVC